MILAGDVGGTKVHLALYDFTNGNLQYTRDERDDCYAEDARHGVVVSQDDDCEHGRNRRGQSNERVDA